MSHVRYPNIQQSDQQNPKQIKNRAGTISNINRGKLPKNAKIHRYASTKFVACVLAIVMVATASGLIGYNIGKNGAKQEISLLPEECIMINLPLDVTIDENVYDYAKGFYTENYEGIYPSIENYEEAILKINDIGDSNFNYNDTIKIPIIIENNNEYYIKIQKIMDQIRNIEENEYFVNHIVQYGETISYYAYNASGNHNEAHEKIKEIMEENGLTDEDLNIGDNIRIINPKLGALKISLQDTIREYLKFLENNKSK